RAGKKDFVSRKAGSGPWAACSVPGHRRTSVPVPRLGIAGGDLPRLAPSRLCLSATISGDSVQPLASRRESPVTTSPFSVQPTRRGRSVRREATAGPHGASSGGPQFVALNSCGRRPPACFRPVAFPRPAAKEIACPESEWLWRRFPAAGRVGAQLGAACRQGAPGEFAGCDRRLCRRGRLKCAFVLEIC